MRTLIVEDDPNIADFLLAHLPERGFAAIDLARTAESGIAFARQNSYDVVLLDLNLPDLPGERVCEALQSLSRIPPILVLTVAAGASDKVRLLESGADDYLVKPFSFDELVARMRALLRRPPSITPDMLTAEGITLDAVRHTVTAGESPVSLTRTEFALLEYLMRHSGALVPKGELVEHVWDERADPLSAAIETHMTNLRKKLGQSSVIRTVHGRGYRIG